MTPNRSSHLTSNRISYDHMSVWMFFHDVCSLLFPSLFLQYVGVKIKLKFTPTLHSSHFNRNDKPVVAYIQRYTGYCSGTRQLHDVSAAAAAGLLATTLDQPTWKPCAWRFAVSVRYLHASLIRFTSRNDHNFTVGYRSYRLDRALDLMYLMIAVLTVNAFMGQFLNCLV